MRPSPATWSFVAQPPESSPTTPSIRLRNYWSSRCPHRTPSDSARATLGIASAADAPILGRVRSRVRRALAVGGRWWAFVGIAFSAGAIWSIIKKPPIPWWAIALIVLGLLLAAQFLHAHELA